MSKYHHKLVREPDLVDGHMVHCGGDLMPLFGPMQSWWEDMMVEEHNEAPGESVADDNNQEKLEKNSDQGVGVLW